MKLKQRVAPKLFGSDLTRAFREKVVIAARSRRRRPDDGGLLVEVLVGMLILVVVFTATTIGLTSMADQRVKIEQRDRALALVAKYEELSRTFKCGFVVDKVADSLAKDPAMGDPTPGYSEFKKNVDNCDFEAVYNDTPRLNAGDQDFVVEDNINENDSVQKFEVIIRYWYEDPGQDTHEKSCGAIQLTEKRLPVILTRSIMVVWTERGVEREVSIIKRDPVPSDSVVFASGNRMSLLVPTPLSVSQDNTRDWSVEFHPYPTIDPDLHILRYVDHADDRLDGQPSLCAWFPYITPDDTDREFVIDSYDLSGSTVSSSQPSIAVPTDIEPQDFRQVL